MHILYIDWPCFGKNDLISFFQQEGYDITYFFHKNYTLRKDKDFDNAFDCATDGISFDCCFSYNYFPIVSENCKRHGIKYISLVYDSPQVALYSYTIINPNNYVFLFDKTQYLSLKKEGIQTVYYSPLPVNSDRIEPSKAKAYAPYYASDISFVGSLYNEDHNFFDHLTSLPPYYKGYLEGIMEAQIKTYGYNFIEELLTPKMLHEFQACVPYNDEQNGVQTPAYVYANYFIARKLTSIERIRTIKHISSAFPLTIYTLDSSVNLPNVTNRGTIDYHTQMPYVFANSKINLNITLRSISSGIPLRAMDILSCGGFLMSNFQADFLDYFTPNEDFVYYESLEDLNHKIKYYLSHETQRQQLASNGYGKVRDNHNFKITFDNIFAKANL